MLWKKWRKFYDMPISSVLKGKSEYKNEEKYGTLESCAFARVWIEKNWQEIGRLYCEVDPAIKNVLEGDNCCESITKYKDQNKSENE
ncbi:MAG: hypothetical protein ACPLRZ_10705 [Thermovenabulum sp.]|uniref:hypothetical protein n=1 Tax=Thermovenabulum sp. TaxID=3100335 RepID=UPI003C7CB3E0